MSLSHLCCNFVRTTSTCMPTNITILQCELDFYTCMSSVPILLGGGWGVCSETLPYSKFRHISWEQMMTKHRGLSVSIFLRNLHILRLFGQLSFYVTPVVFKSLPQILRLPLDD